MRNIWNIFKLDIKNITTNWVVAILIGGLIILPSLYAWLNIKASWDPYGQTDQIPIGLVNEDKGATIRDKEVHVGDSLVEVLRKNEDFNWQFVDRKKALEEVEYGNYYAVIIVPEDFSETLGTVITDSPEKAQIEYYVNEKINSIAPKITEKGASVIVEQISSEFIATVNGVIFDMFNQIGLEIEEGLPDIQQFEQYIFTLESELPNIHDLLTSTNKDADNAKQIIKKANKLIPEVKSTADNGLNTVDKALKILEEAENRLKNMAPKINEDLKKIQSTLTNVHERLGQIDTSDINVDKQKESLQQMNNRINQSMESLEEMKNVFLQIQENMAEEKESVTSAIERVETLVELLQFIQDEATKIDQFVNENESKIAKIKEGLKNIDELASTNIDKFIEEYTNTIEPTVFKELKRGKDTITQAKNMLVEVKSTIPKVERLLKNTNNHLDEGKGMLETVLKEFPYIKDKVKEVANQIRKVQSEADVNEIIQLLRNDPEAERGFFAEPVVLNKNELFPIPNYGTGMTPFYTVLSLWDGALLLISLLTTDFPSMEGIRAHEMYIGRLFTFILIGLLQTIIVTAGDIFLIEVDVSSKLWFILFGLFISVVFMIIVYTVVSIFGDVGKAMAIVLLVLQISSSGGTYPVVLLPEFFQKVSPFLPFTYAVDLMREAVGGIIWVRSLNDIFLLSLFGVIFVLVGLFLKKPLNRLVKKLMSSKSSRLFH